MGDSIMLEFLNAYSAIIVGVLLGCSSFYQATKERKKKYEREEQEKKEKEKHEQIIRTIMAENNKNAEKQELKDQIDAKEKEELNKNIKRLNDAMVMVDENVNNLKSDFKSMQGEFSNFQKETESKFSKINENGLLTMQYTRGIASVTMDVLKTLDNQPHNAAIYQRFADLCQFQDAKIVESMFSTQKKPGA